jgi:hypothetical protein
MQKFFAYFSLFLSGICFSAEYPEKLLTYDVNGNISKRVVPHAGEVVY